MFSLVDRACKLYATSFIITLLMESPATRGGPQGIREESRCLL